MDQEEIWQRTLQVNVIALSPQWVTRDRKGRERLPASECTQLKPAHCNCIAAASGKELRDTWSNVYNWVLHKRVLSLTESIAAEILILKRNPRPGQPFAQAQGKPYYHLEINSSLALIETLVGSQTREGILGDTEKDLNWPNQDRTWKLYKHN